MKLIIFATHPIQYQVPIFQALAKKIDLLVVYCLKQTAKGQADAGFGVEFEWDIPLLDGYQYRYLDNYSKSPSSSEFKGIVIDKKQVKEVLEEFNPSHALVHGWFPKAMLQILDTLKEYKNIKVLSRGDSTLMMASNPIKRVMKELYIRWVLQKIDLILYVGKENKKFFKHYGTSDNNLLPAYHCINTPLFESKYNGKKASSNNKIRFGFVGKFIAIKQPQIILEAVANSRFKDQVVVNFIGSGPLDTELKELANNLGVNVSFFGFMNQTEIIENGYPYIDCLLLPSLSETWGLVVNEAMTLGIPCITSNKVGCHSDLIIEGKTGSVFNLGDNTDFTNKINFWADKIISDNVDKSYIVKHISDYSLQNTVDSYINAINQTH